MIYLFDIYQRYNVIFDTYLRYISLIYTGTIYLQYHYELILHVSFLTKLQFIEHHTKILPFYLEFRLGDHGRQICILKLDVEGMEFHSFPQILKSGVLKNIDQIHLEVIMNL